MPETTSNPIGQFKFRDTTNTTISPPSPDLAKKQDPAHSEADFTRDLDKATRRKPAAS